MSCTVRNNTDHSFTVKVGNSSNLSLSSNSTTGFGDGPAELKSNKTGVSVGGYFPKDGRVQVDYTSDKSGFIIRPM